MLTDIPYAQKYFVNPLKIEDSIENRMFSPNSLIEIGGTDMMNEISMYLDDKHVVLVMGVSEDRCLIFADLTDIEVIDMLDKAKKMYAVKLGRILDDPKNREVAEQAV